MTADVGAADPALLAALEAGDPAKIAQAFPSARLLVAVIALPGQEHASEGEMALALLESADGHQALPAFTGLAALNAWRPDARPVPRPANEVIAYAVAESLAAVVLDPGARHACTLWPDDLATLVGPKTAETGYASPTWRPGRRARRAAASHEVYAVDTPDGAPAVAIVCPDGTLDADWAQRLLAACPSGTQLIALPPAARLAAARTGIQLSSSTGTARLDASQSSAVR
jgi:hypothetical protein